MKKKRIILPVSIVAALLLFTTAAEASVGTFREETKQRESQLDAGYNSVSQEGEWKITVQGHSVVATGVGPLPWQFVFSDLKTGARLRSTLVTNAFPVPEDAWRFYSDWNATVNAITHSLKTVFDSAVNFTSHDCIPLDQGFGYLYYCELWTDDRQSLIPVTMAWRFEQSYYMFSMGVNLGDMPEVFQITRDTAMRFRDDTSQPLSGYPQTIYTGEYRDDLPPWDYPVVDPIWILCEYLGVERVNTP